MWRTIYQTLDNFDPRESLQIQEAIEKWTHHGSGWIVDSVVGMSINISKYQPLRGGSL